MKNGKSYPLSLEVVKIIEKKRKEYIKMVGVKMSQARFTGIIAPSLKYFIKNIKLNTSPRRRFRYGDKRIK